MPWKSFGCWCLRKVKVYWASWQRENKRSICVICASVGTRSFTALTTWDYTRMCNIYLATLAACYELCGTLHWCQLVRNVLLLLFEDACENTFDDLSSAGGVQQSDRTGVATHYNLSQQQSHPTLPPTVSPMWQFQPAPSPQTSC